MSTIYIERKGKTYDGKKMLDLIPPLHFFLGRCKVSYCPAPGGYVFDGPKGSGESQHLKDRAQDPTLAGSEGTPFRIIGLPVIILKPWVISTRRTPGSGNTKVPWGKQ